MTSHERSAERVYLGLVQDLSGLLDAARRSSARAVNAVMTFTYWEIGRRIVEFEQLGEKRAQYGRALLRRLSGDLTAQFGRGFSVDNLESMRRFYRAFQKADISETLSRKLHGAEPTGSIPSAESGPRFPLPWSHYVRLLSIRNPLSREFYEAEALRGGWSVRQLDRQISTRFYERAALSKKPAMLTKGATPRPGNAVTANEAIRDPLVLEFLGLRDEYSESDLEEALVWHLEWFLLELGGEFAFVGRQRRLRIGKGWYRIDLLLFHRRLRSLVIVDLKIGAFAPADVGQMNVYLNLAKEQWVQEGENPPIGLILSLEKDEALARYALDGLGNKVLAREYRLVLPDEKLLAKALKETRKEWESRNARRGV